MYSCEWSRTHPMFSSITLVHSVIRSSCQAAVADKLSTGKNILYTINNNNQHLFWHIKLIFGHFLANTAQNKQEI